MKNNNNRPRIIFGILLIVLGTLFLLDNYNLFDFSIPSFIFKWQSILIILGAYLLLNNSKDSGLILISIGLIGLFPNFWPLLLVVLGLYIIFRQSRGNSPKSNHKGFYNENPSNLNVNEFLDDVSIFGGGKKIVNSQNFKGGKITSIFGGSEIDFYDAKLADGVNYLDVVCIFGGNTLHLPKDWNIEFDVVPVFGGFSDKRRKIPNLTVDPNKKLIVKGTFIFGGLEIKD
jgi:predicted membrane protein